MNASQQTRWQYLLGLLIALGIMACFALANSAPARASSTEFPVWQAVAACESGGNWASTSNPIYDGGLQFDPNTWNAFGGDKYAPTADQASEEQQIAIARRVLATQGPGAWPTCGAQAGLTRANGGADPNATADTSETVPAPDPDPVPAEVTVTNDHPSHGKLVGFGAPPAGEKHDAPAPDSASAPNPLQALRDLLHIPSGGKAPQGLSSIQIPEVHPAPVVVAPPPAPAPAPDPAPAPSSLPGGWAAPLDCDAIITTWFGVIDSLHPSAHQGADLACPKGSPIYSIQDGTVISCGDAQGFGQWVRVLGDAGMSVYGHVEDLLCSVGQHVNAGDQIATVGSRGQSTGDHLHLEIYPGGEFGSAADPFAFIGTPDTWGQLAQTVIDTVTEVAPEILAAAPDASNTAPAPHHDTPTPDHGQFGAPGNGGGHSAAASQINAFFANLS